MVRYTLAIRGKQKQASTVIVVEEKEVDILHGAQIEQKYLCEVNPKGQVSLVKQDSLGFTMADILIKVPVLAGIGHLQTPITDSLEITLYLMNLYPDLQPATHKQQILRLLHELHAINYFSLSFGANPHFAHSMKDDILQRMKVPSISERYREALEYKLAMYVCDPFSFGKISLFRSKTILSFEIELRQRRFPE